MLRPSRGPVKQSRPVSAPAVEMPMSPLSCLAISPRGFPEVPRPRLGVRLGATGVHDHGGIVRPEM
jgi:hypothetical protein